MSRYQAKVPSVYYVKIPGESQHQCIMSRYQAKFSISVLCQDTRLKSASVYYVKIPG